MKSLYKYPGLVILALMIGLALLYWLMYRSKKRRESGYYRDNFLCLNIPPNLPGVGCEPGQLFDLNPASSSYCVDCGPGGMFGPGWTMEKFQQRYNHMYRRAYELSGGLQGANLDRAVQNAGGLIPYIKGREINIKRIENSTKELNGVMNIPGVHGIGTMMNEHIHIAVLNETAKQKVKQFIAEKNKKFIPGVQDGTYGGIPVMIAIEPQAKAQ